MMRFLIFIVSALACHFILSEAQLTAFEREKVNEGLRHGKAITDLLEDQKFSQTVSTLASSAGKFLGAVGPLVGFILNFLPTAESATMRLMKAEFAKINRKLDKLPFEFQEVKNLIDWRAVQVTYSEEEKSIRSLSESLTKFTQAKPRHLRLSYSNSYKRKFSAGFRDAAYKLYDAFANNDQLLAKNLVAAAEKYAERDRKRVRTFMLGLTQLILRGAELEIAYYRMTGDQRFSDQKKKDWEARMKKVASEMRRVDLRLERAWHSQSGQDLDKFGAKNSGRGNKDFARDLYNLLAKKYYWRKWFVAVYEDVHGYQHHAFGFCGGHQRLRHWGKNVIVASSTNGAFNNNKAKGVLDSLSGWSSTKDAKRWYDALVKKTGNKCSDYAFKGIVCWGCDVWFWSLNDRRHYKKLERKKKVCTSQSRWFPCRSYRYDTVGHISGVLFG